MENLCVDAVVVGGSVCVCNSMATHRLECWVTLNLVNG